MPTIEASGLEWTHLWPGEFMVNTWEWAESIKNESVVRVPFGDWNIAMVHEADVAAVAVAALLEDRHIGATYTISGPEAITELDQVRLISAAIGREIRFEELNQEQTHELWGSWGWPAEAIDLELFVLSEFVDEPAPIGTTVADLLGRTTRTFAQWAVEHADNFR